MLFSYSKNVLENTMKNTVKVRRSVLVLLLFVLLLAPVSAVDFEFHGSGNVDFGFGVWNRTDILLAKAKFQPKLEFFHDDFHALVSVKAGYNALNPTNFDFVLGEIYAEYAWDFFDFRIGRQLISWGKADGLAITDVLCGKDYSEFIGTKYKGSRIPANAIQLRFFGSFYTVEGIWVPVYFPSLPKKDETNPMNYLLFPAEKEIEKLGVSLPIEYTINENKMKHRIQDGEWALRASFFFPEIDFSFSAFRGWDHDANFEVSGTITPWNPPTFSPAPTKASVDMTPSHNRIWMAGFDMAIPVSILVIKAEAAWLGFREFSHESFDGTTGKFAYSLEQHHQLKAMLGLEINPGSGWMINMQYMEDVVFENTDTLARSQRLPLITAFVSKTLLHDNMKIFAGILIGCDAWDTASSLGISYKVMDSLKLSLNGTVYCKGIKEGTFGKLSELSNIKAAMEFTF